MSKKTVLDAIIYKDYNPIIKNKLVKVVSSFKHEHPYFVEFENRYELLYVNGDRICILSIDDSDIYHMWMNGKWSHFSYFDDLKQNFESFCFAS